MTSLLALRCFHHPGRQAAARCPSCARSFCRECVTEHDGRVLCVACLAREGREAGAGRRVPVAAGLAAAAGLLLAWTVFFLAGRLLASLPGAGAEEAGFGDPPRAETAR